MIDIHALSGAYAVDALDDLERAEFKRHLAQCPACRAEVDSLREASALLAETVLATPPVSLRASVLADIATVRPLPPVVAEVTRMSSHRGAARRRFPQLVAAAAVLAAVGVGGVVWHPWSDDSSQTTLSATDRVLGAPDATTFTQALANGGKAEVTVSKAMNQAVLQTTGLDDLATNTIYELWLQHDGTMVPAGTMTAEDRTVLLSGDPATAAGAGITVEPAGGSQTPSNDVVALIPFSDA